MQPAGSHARQLLPVLRDEAHDLALPLVPSGAQRRLPAHLRAPALQPERKVQHAQWRLGKARQNWASRKATLSRHLQELRLEKPQEGYRPAAALPEESNGLPSLARALGEFLQDIRPAENLLVLKTPPSGAQPLAAAVDAAKFPETAGTIAGDDTVLIITPDKKSRESLQKKIESLVSRRP